MDLFPPLEWLWGLWPPPAPWHSPRHPPQSLAFCVVLLGLDLIFSLSFCCLSFCCLSFLGLFLLWKSDRRSERQGCPLQADPRMRGWSGVGDSQAPDECQEEMTGPSPRPRWGPPPAWRSGHREREHCESNAVCRGRPLSCPKRELPHWLCFSPGRSRDPGVPISRLSDTVWTLLSHGHLQQGLSSVQARPSLPGAQTITTVENKVINSQPSPTGWSRQVAPNSRVHRSDLSPQACHELARPPKQRKTHHIESLCRKQQTVESAAFLIQKLFQIPSEVFSVPRKPRLSDSLGILSLPDSPEQP